jgi:hypothetical protein|tara:strand:+ start:329 stop:1210 length:882 start_codon:yes stop_codon:yes gene_type:complete
MMNDIRAVSSSETDKNATRFWRHRFRITIQEESTFQERKAFLMSGRRIVFTLLGFMAIIIMAAYFFIAHTPFTKYLVPGYVAESYRHDAMVARLQTDSALRQIELQERYLGSLRTILDGGVPLSLDSLKNTLGLVEGGLPAADSVDLALREKVESEDQFSLKRNGPDLGLDDGFGVQPVVGVVSDGFNLVHGHIGVDISAADGVLVHSVEDGVVLISAYTAEHGYVMAIQHRNDKVSIYKHSSSLLKGVGDVVRAGDGIAVVGSSGSQSTGTHLHFEWWVKGKPIDPSPWLLN